MEFGSLPLAEETKKKLAGFFETGQLPHALLLEGGSAADRKELTELLSAGAVCRREGAGFPCGVCPGCVKARARSHPDISVSGGGEGPALRVDEIRRIRRDASVKPNEAERKAYVLLEAQDMTEQAQNALLKILEEPPAGVVFMLTLPSASLLLPTVRSRVQLFRLEERAEEAEEEIRELASRMAEAVTLPGESALLYAAAPLIRDKEKLRKVLSLLVLLFRDGCVLRAGGAVCLSGLPENARELSEKLTRGRLLRLLETAEKAGKELEGNANAALMVTCLCARMRAAAGR